MDKTRLTRVKLVAIIALAAVVLGGIGFAVFPAIKEAWTTHAAQTPKSHVESQPPVELFRDKDGNAGLRLSKEVVKSFKIEPDNDTEKAGVEEVKTPRASRPLPPQVGTVNFDSDRLFVIRPRFQGELAEIRKVLDTDHALSPSTARQRPLRYGDQVKEGDLLAVVWSKDLGEKKAALVDAICGLRLSKDMLARQAKLYQEGALPLAVYKQTERQVQADTGAVLTAERTLKIWKLSDEEITAIKEEANRIHDLKMVRSADDEKRWARVEVKVPHATGDRSKDIVVVEKNTNIGDMVDPSRDPPLFRLADLGRLQIWVHPPEEYLPLLQKHLEKGRLEWEIRFQADPSRKPLKLPILQIARSLDFNVHTPMVIGYLPNPEHRFLAGQFVTATIYVAPEPDTVEVPANAVNEEEGESLVFVQTNAAKREYTLKRVAAAQRFKDVIYVRSKLTDRDKKNSEEELKRGKRPIRPLSVGERVLTRGVVELAEALEKLDIRHRVDKQKTK